MSWDAGTAGMFPAVLRHGDFRVVLCKVVSIGNKKRLNGEGKKKAKNGAHFLSSLLDRV